MKRGAEDASGPGKQRKLSTDERSAMQTFDSPVPDLNGKRIMVTGGTGSFGKAFIRTLLNRFEHLARIVVYSRDELKQFEQMNALKAEFPEKHGLIRFVIGDVRDEAGLKQAMEGIDVVVHAAAIKQVPTAEKNPFETVKTNIFGAQNVITAALHNNVDIVIALSTDKAANPSNLYGATKLASDKLFVAANHISEYKQTRFCVVRYGNVLGSRGSVVPVWLQRLADGSTSLPLTHESMTRFWINLEQAVAFVISSLALTKGGEIFVPKIGALSMAALARALGGDDIGLEDIGVRPGEKLHETMVTVHDAFQTRELSDRFLICPILSSEGKGSASAWEKDGAKAVAHDFEYLSNEAPEITGPQLVELLCRDEALGMNKLPPHKLGAQNHTHVVKDFTRW